ncbi:ABC transporter ATP-binding protein [Actinomycetota bacterium]
MGDLLARLERLSVRYGAREVLRDITIDIERGHQLAVLGPSGAGKSTLIKVLDGQLAPSAGSVRFTGEARQGVVFQSALLFPWLTVGENIAIGLRYAANASHSGPARVEELVTLLGLEQVRDSYPDEVSGGQAQRASLARALAVDPDLLLLDEPFSALDPSTRWELQQWLRAEGDRRHLTSVIVTHDIDEALILADRIVLLGRDGRIARSWEHTPAADHEHAVVHPLRGEIRAAFDEEPARVA